MLPIGTRGIKVLRAIADNGGHEYHHKIADKITDSTTLSKEIRGGILRSLCDDLIKKGYIRMDSDTFHGAYLLTAKGAAKLRKFDI